MDNLTQSERQALIDIAANLKADPVDLYTLIQFESGWNTQAANPNSSAKGLIQFIDSTAVDLGYKSSQDLINRNETVLSQLYSPVYNYLSRYAPYNNSKQRLYMAVFYPKYMDVPADTEFPDSVKAVNPGIETPRDYIRLVDKGRSNEMMISGATILILVTLFFLLKKGLKNV